MSLRAADLLDDGLTDPEAFEILKAEFPGVEFSARTVASFRGREYAQVERERLTRRDAAAKVRLAMGEAGEAGTYAEAAQALLAKMMYELISNESRAVDTEDLVDMGRTLAKIREIDISEAKVTMQREKEEAARRIKATVKPNMTSEQLVAAVDKIMGLA